MSQPSAACIVIPTTGGLIHITGLKERPRLPACHMTLHNDFRPLPLSEDYHHFVTGPLKNFTGEDKVTELSLSDAIESGRSWELPVFIAHLLWSKKHLLPCTSFKEAPNTPLPLLIWATGKLDPELTPIDDDYHIPLKLELSAPFLLDWQQHGGKVLVLLGEQLKQESREAAQTFCHQHGFTFGTISSVEKLSSMMDNMFHLDDPLDRLPARVRLPAQKLPRKYFKKAGKLFQKTAAQLENIKLFPLWRYQNLFWAVFSGLLVIAGLKFISTPSTISPKESNSVLLRAIPAPVQGLVFTGLYAGSRNQCIMYIMNGVAMKQIVLKPKRNTIEIPTLKGLCGLKIQNTSPVSHWIKLGQNFNALVIAGDHPFKQGGFLASNASSQLVFSRQPPTGSLALFAGTKKTDTSPERITISLGTSGK